MRHRADFTPDLHPDRRSGFATIRSLLPYLWPKGDTGAHVRVLLAVLFLVLAKVATVYVPYVYSKAVDRLAPHAGSTLPLAVPVALILFYGGLRIAQSGFGELRDAVFAAVQQRSVRKVALQTFRHMHGLSLRYHLDRQTGGLARSIDRGTAGIEEVLRLSVFNVLPTLLEVSLVTIILWRLFDWRYAAVVVISVVLYISFTLTFTNWRVKLRRQMNESDSDAQTKAVDSLLNYETVKYFGNEEHEAVRFDRALARYEHAAIRSQVTLNMLNLGQATIIASGLAIVMLMAAWQTVHGQLTVGRFVMVNTYLMQLYTPLNLLGFVYRGIKQGLVDMEQMFRLMSEPREIADKANAIHLAEHRSEHVPAGIRFENVHFGYRPDREILKGVDFTVPLGGSIAIVGPTGAGKSTISRLLFRFYDVTDGAVLVDGVDVRDLAQDSLRASIGVVPQDTVLFNDTIGYNIAYGRVGASQADIEAAARAAQVHDFVMRLPDGYNTRVGERGLKLSGGEKQRVAIARTILKDPRILILDEATSALDTRTEQDIQGALRALSANRTTLTIAHRLSTVVDADQILVLDEGEVVEIGTHADLLSRQGLYAKMWARQAEDTEVAA
jgi:ABC-type transport system involved in Fe-S cluster assembly fused permease/ATPase subunit